jgi:serine phosphatase RsbU (regulator of sigma subunit)
MFKKEVSESLRYAAKLQKALLQDKEELKESLPGSFVMFQPKNIVSGDFYWFQNNNDKVYVSVGDCTGHGVPGALMNIMSLNMLHSTYKHEQMISPSLLLHTLDKDLHDKLSHKSTGKKMMNDSVDITICEIDKKKMILTFSGANSNVYLKRKNSVRRFKTDRYSIGTAEADKQFGTEQISIEKGDILFLLSDGFIDQFGGEKGKKFGSKRFYELLENLDAEQFENYKKIFPAVFSAWKGKEEQTDDVLVMGIRI